MANTASSNPIMTHQQDVIPTGQHDTHLYDPGVMNGHQLMAVYETAARAGDARDKLLAMGVAPGSVQVLDRTQETASQEGLWGTIKRFLIPDEDAAGYAESLQRGHAVLIVNPPESQRVAVIRAIEDSDPIDFDARLEEWRQAGWNALSARQQAGDTGIHTASPAATTTAIGKTADVVQSTSPNSGRAAEAERVVPTGDVYDTETRTTAPATPRQRLTGSEYARVRGYGQI